jgi:hypothetical protein
MKLYNLFESVILEEINNSSRLLTEGAADDDIIASIDGQYNVNIEYRDVGQTVPSKRYIQVYVFGQLTNGNYGIRAYQIQGGSKSNQPSEWKIFRVDRIASWNPTKMKWHKPVSDYSSYEVDNNGNVVKEKSPGYIGKYNPNGDNKGNFHTGESVPTFKRIINQYNPINEPNKPEPNKPDENKI